MSVPAKHHFSDHQQLGAAVGLVGAAVGAVVLVAIWPSLATLAIVGLSAVVAELTGLLVWLSLRRRAE